MAEAAGGSSLEVTTQAVEILRHSLKSDNTATHEAAKRALEKLAKGDNSAASQAREALAPPPAPATQPQFAPRFGGKVGGFGGGFGGGGIQIGIGGQIPESSAGRSDPSLSRSGSESPMGRQPPKVDENGKKIKIEKDANGGIEMRVTQKVNGQDKTDTYKAKDADDLKKNSPEGYKIYEKYGQQGQASSDHPDSRDRDSSRSDPGHSGDRRADPTGAFAVPVLPAIPVVPQPQAVPVGPPQADQPAGEAQKNAAGDAQKTAAGDAQKTAAGDARQNAASELARARRLIYAAAEQLKQTSQPDDSAESSKKAVDNLQAALDKLDEAQRSLKP